MGTRSVAAAVALTMTVGVAGGSAALAGTKTPTSMGFNKYSLVTGSDGRLRQTSYTGLYAGGDVLQGERITVKYRKMVSGSWQLLAKKQPVMDDQNQTATKFGGVPAHGWCSLVAIYPGDATHAGTKVSTGKFYCNRGGP